MTLEELGYSAELENYRKEQNLDSFGIARVISENKERYIVKNTEKEFDAEIIGNFRFSAQNRSDFPAVGDWVAISEYDENKVLIHAVLPRKTIIERQAVGKTGEKQIIATNVDFAFIVQAVDRDFNINRIERYLTICYASRVTPIIVLSKIDLINELKLESISTEIKERIKNVGLLFVSSETNKGIEKLLKHIQKGKTYCLLGSSGVGKSTLLNTLSGELLMETNSISKSTNKGRHVTSRRELHILKNGGILIDNPGIREVGIADAATGIELTFNAILHLSKNCKFNNCTHINEKDCAILEALENNKIDKDVYENFMKMEREKTHFESTVAEKRRKDKDFGKMIKHFKKNRKSNKY